MKKLDPDFVNETYIEYKSFANDLKEFMKTKKDTPLVAVIPGLARLMIESAMCLSGGNKKIAKEKLKLIIEETFKGV